MQHAILVHAAVHVEGGRIRPNSGQVVGPDVQDVLPVMSAIHASRRTPLHEKQQPLLGDIARGLVHLEGELLQLCDGGVGSYDIEEAFIVGYEAGLVNVLVAKSKRIPCQRSIC